MYHGPARRTPDEDDRRRRESQISYSPTHSHPFSPNMNGSSHRSPHQSPMSTHMGTSANSTRYDPLFEHRDSKGGQRPSHSHAYSPPTTHDLAYEHLEGKSSRKSSHSYTTSPTQVGEQLSVSEDILADATPQSREPLPPYKTFPTNSKSPSATFRSPTESHFPQRSPHLPSSHAHPASRQESTQYSPEKLTFVDQTVHAPPSGLDIHGHVKTNGFGDPPSSQETIEEESTSNHKSSREEKTPAKRSDPMSFSNILSSGPPDPPKPTVRATPATRVFKNSTSAPDGEPKARPTPRKSQSKTSSSSKAASSGKSLHKGDTKTPSIRGGGGGQVLSKLPGNAKRKSQMLLQKENEQIKLEMVKIDAMELSDLDSPEYLAAKEAYALLNKKRALDIETAELPKRKVSLQLVENSINE